MPRSGWLQLFQTSALHKEEAKKDVKKQARKKARHAAKEKSRGDQHIPILTYAADVHCGLLLPPDIPVFLLDVFNIVLKFPKCNPEFSLKSSYLS